VPEPAFLGQVQPLGKPLGAWLLFALSRTSWEYGLSSSQDSTWQGGGLALAPCFVLGTARKKLVILGCRRGS
jgi:hypothetical protein